MDWHSINPVDDECGDSTWSSTTWEARELGDKLTVQLPYKALTFTVSSLENVPQYLSCSLHSPLDPNLTNEQAVQLTQDCLRMVLSIPTAQPTF